MKLVTLALSAIALSLVIAFPVFAEDVIRVKVGKDYNEYSNTDLRRRVWELERAVDQLQRRIFQLEVENRPIAVSVGSGSGYSHQSDSWVCTITAMGDRFTGTGGSKAVAIARASESCKAGRGGDGFFCKDPDCTQ